MGLLCVYVRTGTGGSAARACMTTNSFSGPGPENPEQNKSSGSRKTDTFRKGAIGHDIAKRVTDLVEILR